ncbi:MAG: alkyl hydroperoxide reductase AhpD [Candidatus Hydrogenedentota bacterium]
MPRVQLVNTEQAQGKAREIMEGLQQRAGKVYGMYKCMANSPAVLEGFLALSGAMGRTSLPVKLREQIALLLAEENECTYCLAAHTAGAMKAGLTEAQTIQSRMGQGIDEKSDAVLRFAQRMLDTLGHVSDDDVNALRAAGVTDQELVEIVSVVCLNIFTNYFNHIMDTPSDFPAAPDLPN